MSQTAGQMLKNHTYEGSDHLTKFSDDFEKGLE